MGYYKRALEKNILKGLKDMPAVFINGPRQAGKSTLALHLAKESARWEYVTFDDITTLAAATHNPEGFISGFSKPTVIDEVQLVPEIFRVLKKRVDWLRQQKAEEDRGRFLLTGSANILALPRLADALVGRMMVYTLYPLSVGEILKTREGFVQEIFEKNVLEFKGASSQMGPLEDMVGMATFPYIASDPKIDRAKWFDSYLTTLLQRDIRSLAEIEKVAMFPTILKLLATRVGGLLNDASLARDAGLNPVTYHRYRTLLGYLFLLISVPPWYRNMGKRLVKSPKIFFSDTSLLCHLLGIDLATVSSKNPTLFGAILENIVASELTKQLACHSDGTLYHFRTHDNKEVDFIIERRSGQIVTIEVKARASVTAEDFKVMRSLQEAVGKDFIKGIVLYQGNETVPFGKNFCALPLSALWRLNSEKL